MMKIPEMLLIFLRKNPSPSPHDKSSINIIHEHTHLYLKNNTYLLMVRNEQSSGNNISIYLRPNKQDIRRLKYIKYQQQIYISVL